MKQFATKKAHLFGMRINAAQPALGFGIGLSGQEGDEKFAVIAFRPANGFLATTSRKSVVVRRTTCA